MEDVKRPLDGVKVVEMATFIAVPAVGRILADMGAEVIKIESAKGDNLRFTAPNEGRPSDPHEDTNFDLENANKKGIVLDLRQPKGKEVLFKLLDDADVFLTNWRPGALARQNLTYDELKVKYPKLIYASLTGYGDKGPDKDLPGWQRTGETDAYALYENENWVPMGFTYDCYVTADQLERVSEEERAQILCRAILLDDDQISAFGSLLEPLPDEELTNRGEDAYAADCAARRAAGVAAFTATDTGFTAKTAYDADELVFFSVPYDDGFSATVNGEPAAIEKVDDGLMAVYVPAGENEIEFTYHTPGLKVSACVSAAAIAVYGVYLLGIIRKRKSQPGSKR